MPDEPCGPPKPTPWYKSKRVRSGVVTLLGAAGTALSLAGHFNIWVKIAAVSVTGIAAALNQFWALTADRPVEFRKPTL